MAVTDWGGRVRLYGMRPALRALSLVLATSGLFLGCSVEDPGGGSGGASGAGAAQAGSSAARAGSAGQGGGALGGSGGKAGAGGVNALAGQGGSNASGGGGSPNGGAGAGGGGAARGGESGETSVGGRAGGENGGAGAGAGASGAATSGSSSGGNAGATASGGSSAGGSAGTNGGASGDDDRCDVAVYDAQNPPEALTLSGNLGTHDPVVIEADGRFYLFSTGNNLGAKTSTDLTSWQAAPEVFSSMTRPAWIADEVPGASNLWAPDISYFGGSYHLYYSASTFGSNHSCIGHLTRAALDAGSWTDRGSVICSNAGAADDDWNAIDPNVVVDREGKAWLAFGSFWGGLKLIPLDANGARVGTSLQAIAARPNNGGALEAPYIVRRCGYYYLFSSFDRCCDGVNSTYNIRVGRSTSVSGPYSDKNGTALMQGGGTPVLSGGTRWKGPGHNAVIFSGNAAYNVYHSYDANNGGDPFLRISEIAWDSDGWPISGGP